MIVIKGSKIVIKIHQNFLPCLLVLIYGVFLAFLAASGRFQRALVLSLFVLQEGLVAVKVSHIILRKSAVNH